MDKISNDKSRLRDGGTSRGSASGARLGAAVVLPALLAALPSCEQQERQPNGTAARPEAGTIAPTAPLTILDAVAVIRHPTQYASQKVVLGGTVHRVLGPRTFTIGGPEFGGELLIAPERDIGAVPNRPAGKYIAGGDILVAAGTVRTFVSADAKKVFGADVKEDAYAEFLGKPYLDAAEIALTPRSGPQAQPTGEVSEPITDIMAVLGLGSADRQALAGKRVQLAHVTVQKVVNDQAFWVGPSDKQMIFVRLDQPPAGDAKIAKGKSVAITGEIRKAPSTDQAKKQWSLSAPDADELAKAQTYLHAQQARPLPPSSAR